jgi:Fic/DOC family
LAADPAELIARHRWRILARLVPDALIADRSAAENGMPTNGVLTIISSTRREDLVLPGLRVVPRVGPGPLADDQPWAADLRITSDARTLVDNLAISRSRGDKVARTLSRRELTDWLIRKEQRRGGDWLRALRARALEVCEELGLTDRRPLVEDIIGAVAGTRPRPSAAGPLLAARASGREYDPERVERFDQLAAVLADIPTDLDVPTELPARPDEAETSLAFFEAYFSNFIEGTEFSVEEAEAIIETGDVPESRPEDAHDVLGTYGAITDPWLRAAIPATAEELLALLDQRHRLVMSGRPDKRPGRFKEKPNQAGSYVFVAPALVEGTLLEGFRRLTDLPLGFPRAAFELFLISEVHPYDDGNGRVARAAMCAELTHAGQSRLIVPTVFRNEYQTALRSLSRDARCDLYVRTLVHAWRWTAGMPWQDRAAVDGRLAATNALVDSTDAERSGVRLELP